MRKPKISVFISIILLGGIFLSTGCETEQTSSKKNDGMVGYAQDHAKSQAELINQEQLKKSSLNEAKVVADGTTQSLTSAK
ncbi:hypothetical protein EJP75_15695 [Acinetobacter baumannii]|jgi:hypothetical protein|nr:hypothetical protein EJP75_15695 [Acinetobacter baumannii]